MALKIYWARFEPIQRRHRLWLTPWTVLSSNVWSRSFSCVLLTSMGIILH